MIALKLILALRPVRAGPMVIPPPTIDQPIPIERTPVQQGTDLDVPRTMAQRFGYVFYVDPGPAARS